MVLSLQLPPARLAGLYLRHLGSLPLAVPGAPDLQAVGLSPGDALMGNLGHFGRYADPNVA